MVITIINSEGYWQNGWLPDVKTHDCFVNTLKKNGIKVESFEVRNVDELEKVLFNLDRECLVLPNAYHVNSVHKLSEPIWMGDVLDRFEIKTIGSGTLSLQKLLQKHVCQQILKENGIPVPEFAFIDISDVGNEQEILEQSNLTYPVIIKLTGESCSIGISEESVARNEEEAITKIRKLITSYSQGVILETFLPGKDITAARFLVDGEALHLMTHYEMESTTVLGQEERKAPWGERKKMFPVKDASIIEQLDSILSKIWDVLEVKDLIRLDGKLDKNGKFHVFDVNGFPGLTADQNTFPVQCNACFLEYSTEEVYEAMLNTIVLSAAKRYQMVVPKEVLENNLFTLNGNLEEQLAFTELT